MITTLLKSPAKINLTLNVISFDKKLLKHKLSSKVVLLKLSDIIKVSKANKLNIKYFSGKKRLLIKNDIINKTIKYFDKKYGTQSNFNISIIKNIPIGYGLGGGSSNSAAILKFLYKYNNIDKNNFYIDAPRISSDVLLFIDKNAKIIDGLLKYKKINIKNPRWKKLFILFPSKKNLTKKVFDFYKKNNYIKVKKLNSQNDLLHTSMMLNKEFNNLYNFLDAQKIKFNLKGMSGSGSSIFISFKSNTAEKHLIKVIRSKYPLVRIEKSYYFS